MIAILTFLFQVFIGFIVFLATIVQMVFYCILMNRIGIAWWKGLIPYYSFYVLFEEYGINPWFCLFAIFPPTIIVTTIFMYMAMYKICKGFGYDAGMLVLCILVPPVGYGILAFTKRPYHKIDVSAS